MYVLSMKKAILFFAFFLALGIAGANAQSCAMSASKSCCAGKIAKAMTADPNIEKRTAEDGTVSYVRKEVDQQGAATFVSVRFDEPTATFVNVAPKSMATPAAKAGAVKKTCTAEEMKSCTPEQKKACAKVEQ
jgi:hypothetical protein